VPIYEYRCDACEEHFERLFLSLKQIPVEIICPACQSTHVQRVMSAPALRKIGEGGSTPEVEESAPAKPPVFGRQELNQVLENKKRLRESVQTEKAK
jgi:putative FmdB family regulatory protein